MPAKHARHIALTAPLAAWVDSQVAKGEYTSASDLVRTALRLLRVQSETATDPKTAPEPPPAAHGRA